MKKSYSFLFTTVLTAFSFASFGQNTFPDNANVGIGTLNPTEKLDVRGNILWDGFNSGNPRAVKIGYSGGNYGGIGYNIDYTGTTGIFNRPLNDHSSYLEFWAGGFRFFGSSNGASAQGVNLGGSGDNLSILATLSRSGNFGIGTDNPAQKFVVSNNGTDGFEVYLSQPGAVGLQSFNRTTSSYAKMQFDASNFAFIQGNVGIGTTAPEQKLDVQGSTIVRGDLISTITDPNIGGRIQLNNPAKTANGAASSWQIFNMSGTYGNSLQFWAYDNVNCSSPNGLCSNRFTLMDNGNVGIGTAIPNSKLAVNGNIRAHEIKVETANWPDFVFTKDYQLPTLPETEKHIKEKGHLPGIPSAAEVKANGVDLGEMNAKLLQKIEELTLYLIEMKKDAEQHKDQFNKLQLEVTELRTKSLKQ